MMKWGDINKKCFKNFDGAAILTLKNMHTSEMKELLEILTKEIKFREDRCQNINT